MKISPEAYTVLEEILRDSPWEAHKRLKAKMPDFEVCDLNTVSEGEKPSGGRTGAQNAALHLWYRQVAEECQKHGVEASAVFAKTHDIQMTENTVKVLWKALQEALFGKKSTTELKKTGEIDKLQDHFIRFFGEKFELELPPFPNEDKNVRLSQVENLKNDNYPEYHGEPTI